MMLRNEMKSSASFRFINISQRHFVEVRCCMLLFSNVELITPARRKFSAQRSEPNSLNAAYLSSCVR